MCGASDMLDEQHMTYDSPHRLAEAATSQLWLKSFVTIEKE
jgi:hypothetical protein